MEGGKDGGNFCLFKVICYLLPWEITIMHHHLRNMLLFFPTTEQANLRGSSSSSEANANTGG